MSQKWNDEVTKQLVDFVGKETPVSNETVTLAAEDLEYTENSIASKLRKMGYEVVSRAKSNAKTFSDTEKEALRTYVTSNKGKQTFAEIAASFLKGKFTTKQIQGKLLSMELTDAVKKTEKVEVAKTYTDAQEKTLLDMCASSHYVEEIAEALDKTIQSVRGKVLSLLRTHPDLEMPKQRESHAKSTSDGLETLGDVSEMTIEEIAEKLGKTPRGVKVMLTHRGITCKNHKGADKRAKLDEAKKKAA